MHLILLIFSICQIAAAAGLDARGVMAKNNDARKIKETLAEAALRTTGGDKKDNDKKFTWTRKLQSDNEHYSTLTRFHSPPTIRGQGILFHERDGGENEILLYLPTFKKIRRVENQEQTGSFMGSVFSYSDITVAQLNDFSYKMLKDETCPIDTKNKCYVIEQTPIKDAIRVRYGYSRWVNWIRKDNFMLDQRDCYDLSGKHLKRLSAKDTRMLDAKDQRWFTYYLRMENLETKRVSEIQFNDVKLNTGISDATFSQQNLQRGD